MKKSEEKPKAENTQMKEEKEETAVQPKRVKRFPWSANLFTAIITKIGLHDWNTYIAFTRVNKAMRRGVISCLPYQKSLLDQYRISNEMH